MTVERLVERSDQAVGDSEWPQFGHSIWADQVGGHAMVAADHAEVAQLVQSPRSAGKGQRARLDEADVDPGLVPEPAVQSDAVRGEFGERVPRAALDDQTC